ncbi:hypothetical protein BN1723_012694 [Verticillium longisporum]|uniref:Glycosyl transferase CAP10 domain-containing protein n=1 Tax=Verticillium longisporum TaxID=100787 RepID=A0A0G4LKF6_VERLO|nr:hypothetical protein BN1723_012694 [Verticillium longisporum]
MQANWSPKLTIYPERLIHFAILTFLMSGGAIAAGRFKETNKTHLGKYNPDTTYPIAKPTWQAYIDSTFDSVRTPSFRGTCFAVSGIVVRVLLTWRVIRTVHCSSTSYENLLPFFTTVYAASLLKPIQLGKAVMERSDGWRVKLACAHYPIFALIWAHASRVTIRLTSSSAGAICPAGSLRWEPYTPLAQCVTVLVDAMLITQVAESRRDISNAWLRTARILLTSAGVLTFLAMFSFYHPRNIRWALMLDYVAVRDLLVDGSTACVTLLTGIYLLYLHPSTLALAMTAVAVYTHHLARTLASTPPINQSLMTVAVINTVLTPGIPLSLDPRAAAVTGLPASDVRLVRFLARSYVVLTGILFGAFLMCSPDVMLGGAISIQDLISAANVRSDHWVAQANSSTSLVEAVEEYRRRYQVPPPPNFDKWYEYATMQESVVIDDFGQISADLKPFWGRSPADLREQTRHMLSYTPWLSMAGIKIRNGTVDIMPGVPGSHAWMMSAMREMIEPFAQHLPDLDFAMNLNDEPRVAVPYEVINRLQAYSQFARSELAEREELRSFDASQTPTWPEVELRDNMDPSPYFTNELRNQIYYSFVAPACAPTSAARNWRWWSRRDACPACVAPHTSSIFESDSRVVVDWTNATDLCHQPDLAYLHGFLLSPAAVMPTEMAFPVFSQTKAEGFADILLPSPWNFNDKAAYADDKGVLWEQKENTMFWRGSASDGYAARGSWQTSLRARLVHAASHLPRSTSNKPGYGHELPRVDIGFVDEFQKCHQDDCRSEETAFWGACAEKPPLERVPFEQHWQYRHLMDLDGAGFSGRFLPFLRSRSLVYRTGLFRTWFGERVHAWRHYVPVDVRLHELWDLLRFFGTGGEHRHGGQGVGGSGVAQAGHASVHVPAVAGMGTVG